MNKTYKLLTTAIVTALDASNPTVRGAVWTPAEPLDVQEAEALAHIGIAQETTVKATHLTVAERNAGKTARVPISGISVNAIKQSDGTYKNDNGLRVNEDGSAFVDELATPESVKAQYVAFLSRKADAVIADMHKLNKAQASALIQLEEDDKARVTVLEALAGVTDEG